MSDVFRYPILGMTIMRKRWISENAGIPNVKFESYDIIAHFL